MVGALRELADIEMRGIERPGVFWTHTPGPPDDVFDFDTRRLSSHYWSGNIDRDRSTFFIPWLRFLVLPRFPRLCWVCNSVFPEPFLAFDASSTTGNPIVAAMAGGIAMNVESYFPSEFQKSHPSIRFIGAAESGSRELRFGWRLSRPTVFEGYSSKPPMA